MSSGRFELREINLSSIADARSTSAGQDTAILGQFLSPFVGTKQARQLAGTLVKRFGNLSEVIGAPKNLLLEVPGTSPEIAKQLKCIMTAAQAMAAGQVPGDRSIIGCFSDLIEYFRTKMAYEQVEQFRILFLNKKNRLIADELHQTGTVDHTPFYPREVLKRALELSATALILVHNHPSGDPSPSPNDVHATNALSDAAKTLGIMVLDHLIIARTGHFSMAAAKLIGEGSRRFERR